MKPKLTPEEWCRINDELQDAIDAHEELYPRNKKCMPPKRDLRRCVAADIVPGAIIYYYRDGRPDYWQRVSKVKWPDDAFQAYIADDGCRYGIERAFVRKSKE